MRCGEGRCGEGRGGEVRCGEGRCGEVRCGAVRGGEMWQWLPPTSRVTASFPGAAGSNAK